MNPSGLWLGSVTRHQLIIFLSHSFKFHPLRNYRMSLFAVVRGEDNAFTAASKTAGETCLNFYLKTGLSFYNI